MIPIYKKEMRAYFTQMTGYIVLTSIILLIAIYFTFFNVYPRSPRYFEVLGSATILFFIVIPVLTMRLFAEEARHKTDQLLYTSPLSAAQIVMGKFLAATTLFLLGLATTVTFPAMLSGYGELAVAQIFGAYLGYFLMGMCLIAVGLFISVLTDNQIIAAVATFASLFLMFIMDALSSLAPVETVYSFAFVSAIVVAVAFILYNSTRKAIPAIALCAVGLIMAGALYLIDDLIYYGFIMKFLNWFSVYGRYAFLINGILNVSDIVYYVSFTTLFIYLTVNVIEKRRWR